MAKEIIMPVKAGGLIFKNPFIVASGPTTKSVKQLLRIEQTGWAAASIKLTIDPAPYVNRVPRYAIFEDRNALCFTVEKRLTFDEGLKLVEEAKKGLSELILMANITYAGDAGVPGWVNMSKKFEETGADVIELNMCCPNMSYNLELTTGDDSASSIKTGASLGQHGDAVAEIVRAVKAAVSIPVFVKLTPEGGNIAKVAKKLYEAGADVVGGTANRMGIPKINLDNPKASVYHLSEEISMSCHSGAWLKPLAQRDTYEIRKLNGPKPYVMAAGGIKNYKDAIELIMCGADVLGICAETLISGYDFIRPLISDMKKWMDENGYENTRQFRDLIVPEVKTATEVTLYKGHARVKEPNLSAPCKNKCPQHVPAQAYIQKAAKGEFREAYDLIINAAPLQSICSYICDRKCETACTRGINDSPVHIREIKKFIIDVADKNGWKPDLTVNGKKDKKIAVIGSGPAGLSNAFYMAKEGYDVTVFEQEDSIGGMLAQCIPVFRIPKEKIDEEIETIKSMGVKFMTNHSLGRDITIDGLKKDGFSAVFIATGAMKGRGLGLNGEDAAGVWHTMDFLREVKKGNAPDVGKTAVILGGGFSAIDSARTIKRLGACNVYIAYRRTKDEMPAADEIKEAEDEGVRIMYLVAPEALDVKDGKLKGVMLRNQTLGGEDESGRRSPESVICESFYIPCDTLILAVGQEAEEIAGVDMKRGSVCTDALTMKTNMPFVYAGGDAVTVKSVIAAVSSGRRAAISMNAELMGIEFTPEPLGFPETDPEDVMARNPYFPKRERKSLEICEGSERAKNFELYTRALTEDEAVFEAGHCLKCGCGEGCQNCKTICCDFAVELDGTDKVKIDDKECVACGMCFNLCPNKNIEMVNLGEVV